MLTSESYGGLGDASSRPRRTLARPPLAARVGGARRAARGRASFSALAATRSGPRQITGTTKADLLRGSKGRDVIRGLAGADRIFGYRGNDRIDGGPGNDVLVGGAGRDVLVGGPGNDRLNARDGAPDLISCGTGRDTIIQDALDRARRTVRRSRRRLRRRPTRRRP